MPNFIRVCVDIENVLRSRLIFVAYSLTSNQTLNCEILNKGFVGFIFQPNSMLKIKNCDFYGNS